LKESRNWNEELVNELVESSSFLSEILNNTLDMSKLEEGKIEFNINYESIRNVVDIVMSIAKNNAAKKGIKITSEYAYNLPNYLEIDKTRMTQIIMNLVGNAIKFTPEKGRIKILTKWFPKVRSRNRLATEDCYGNIACGTNKNNANINYISSSEEEKTESYRKKSGAESDADHAKRINLDKFVDDQSDKVPDETSPDGGSPKRISRKVNAHKFETNFENDRRISFAGLAPKTYSPDIILRTEPNSYKSRIHKSIDSRQDNGQPIIKTNTPELAPDREKMTDMGFSTLHKIISKTSLKERSKSLIPKHLNGGIIKLQRVAREFRMSSKDLTKVSKDFASNSAKTKYLKKNKVLNNKKRLDRVHSFCTSPTSPCSPEISPKFKKSNMPPKKGLLMIEVIDTGCGMSEAERSKLFQPFVQANKGVQSKFGGTGLGLWLCHKLITAMNGNISCDSELGKGTTFRVSLELNYKTKLEDPKTTKPGSIFQGFNVICLKKKLAEIKGPLREARCNIIACETIDNLLEVLRKHKIEKCKYQVILAGLKSAREIHAKCRAEGLGIKSTQFIVITRIFLNICANWIGKLLSDDESFNYILARPVNKYYLLNILAHAIKGQTLCDDTIPLQNLPTQPKNNPLTTIRALVVDDNYLCRNAVTHILAKHNCEVAECENGDDALYKIKNMIMPFNLAIVDYQMPGMDGIELINHIRNAENTLKVNSKMTIICIFFSIR